MKSLTFIEALQANETDAVAISISEDGKVWLNYKPLSLKTNQNSVSLKVLFESKWRLVEKPKVVVFECEWKLSPLNKTYYPIGLIKNEVFETMCNGKKWRVRCEEILE